MKYQEKLFPVCFNVSLMFYYKAMLYKAQESLGEINDCSHM